jgi:hypothetical protein
MNIKANIKGIGDVIVNQAPPEEGYCWSGYTSDKDDFVLKNFYTVATKKGGKYFGCSLDNSVGLCEFIFLYASESDVWDELDDCLSPGMALWFNIGYEQMRDAYDDLPVWCANIIDCYCNNNLMMKTAMKIDDVEWKIFLFKEPDIVGACSTEIDAILTAALDECKKEKEN